MEFIKDTALEHQIIIITIIINKDMSLSLMLIDHRNKVVKYDFIQRHKTSRIQGSALHWKILTSDLTHLKY